MNAERWNRSGPTLESESGAGVHLPRGLKGNLVTDSSVPHSLESEWANAGIGVRRGMYLHTSVFGRRGNGVQRSAFAGIGVGQRWNRSGPTLESVAAAVVGNADMRFQRQKGYMYLQGYFFGPNQRLWPARERWNRWNRWNLRLPRWSGAGVQRMRNAGIGVGQRWNQSPAPQLRNPPFWRYRNILGLARESGRMRHCGIACAG